MAPFTRTPYYGTEDGRELLRMRRVWILVLEDLEYTTVTTKELFLAPVPYLMIADMMVTTAMRSTIGWWRSG
jgi:hypothetical protein